MLENELKYFQQLYDQLRFPIEVVNEQGKIIYINEAFSLQWGYSIEELKEYSIFDDPEIKQNSFDLIIKKSLNENKFGSCDNFSDSLLKNKEEAVPLLRTGIFGSQLSGEKFAVLFHEDQTERILAEEEVTKARDAGKEAERLKNTFLNVLSHELRTPLNIILGYTSIIRENMRDKMSVEDKIYLDNLYSGSDRLNKSITHMLEFAQIEAGSYTLHVEVLDLISTLHNSINLIKKQASEKNIDIKSDFPAKPILVEVDTHCLENAINNILANAVKFTNRGFVEIETNVLEERDLAICKIRDTGIGISTEYLDHIFQPFSQEDLNIGRNYEGNGLGLALAKKCIEKLGGSLLVDSIKGVGTTFTFTLPLSSTMKKPVIAADFAFNQSDILILDETGEISDLIKAFLKKEFAIVTHDLRNFKIDFLKETNFGVVIFNVSKNFWQQGIIICKDIKTNDPMRRPVIIISSEFMEERISKFMEAGADKYLIKPFTKNELVEALKEVTQTQSINRDESL
ncbi:MAG: response regulator [Ignavibacteriales bacterium]|nr:response regulator [Ignavibacteriales bacterium]